MGLDMYLNKHLYVGGQYGNATGSCDIEFGDNHWNKEGIHREAKEIASLILYQAYWRNANQIHDWFVREVQDGKDDCGRYYVKREKLIELREICKKALQAKDRIGLIDKEDVQSALFECLEELKELMPKPGFFFGSYGVNEWYWDNIESTVKQLENLEEGLDYYYSSSW